LDELRRRSSEKRPAEVNATVARAIQRLRDSGIADGVVSVGERAPAFSLPNGRGEPVSLAQLLTGGPVVLAFYRGGW
jgi:hypothetical protein